MDISVINIVIVTVTYELPSYPVRMIGIFDILLQWTVGIYV